MSKKDELSPKLINIAIICALPQEFDAVRALFDEDFGNVQLDSDDDPNIYTSGKLGRHFVVATLMPSMGKKEAASTAAHFSRSFPNIQLGLLVGVCAGAPRDMQSNDILLGDVIISTAIIQYDFGREYEDQFVRKDTVSDNLPRPCTRLRAFLKALETEKDADRLQESAVNHLDSFLHSGQKDRTRWCYPGVQNDKLFEDGYVHQHVGAAECDQCARNASLCLAATQAQGIDCSALDCDPKRLVIRARLDQTNQVRDQTPMPRIHFGIIASGDRVLRSSSARRTLIQEEKVIGFEMEGAGVWDQFQTIVIKGVCDYGDCHKNKGWQRYAAATAASCMKALLEKWQVNSPQQGLLVAESVPERPFHGGNDASHRSRSRRTAKQFSGTFSSGGRMSVGDQYDSGGGSIHIS